MKKIILTTGLALAIAMSLPAIFAQSANSPSPKTPSPEVRDVAGNPSTYVGRLTLKGVVGIINAQKGFVLVDMKEYQNEGFACLATDEPTKITVHWTGAAPKIKDKVRVEGVLTKEKKGYSFTADKVENQ